MIEIVSTSQAVQLLRDATEDLPTRKAALQRLAAQPTAANLEHLIDALEDPAASIRWVAADELAHLGMIALPPLLRRLVSQHDSAWVREGAHHICCCSSSPIVREQTQELQQALQGLAAEVVATSTAIKLLYELA